MPGLVDVHVHLANNPEDEQRILLKLFLANGVTTVVNLRGIPQILDLRAAVTAGRILGPRIYTAGPFVNEPFVTTPDEVERAVVAQKRNLGPAAIFEEHLYMLAHGEGHGVLYLLLGSIAPRNAHVSREKQ